MKVAVINLLLCSLCGAEPCVDNRGSCMLDTEETSLLQVKTDLESATHRAPAPVRRSTAGIHRAATSVFKSTEDSLKPAESWQNELPVHRASLAKQLAGEKARNRKLANELAALKSTEGSQNKAMLEDEVDDPTTPSDVKKAMLEDEVDHAATLSDVNINMARRRRRKTELTSKTDADPLTWPDAYGRPDASGPAVYNTVIPCVQCMEHANCGIADHPQCKSCAQCGGFHTNRGGGAKWGEAVNAKDEAER